MTGRPGSWRASANSRAASFAASPPNRADYVFVLRGFYIHYVGDDHHIDQVMIEEKDGLATVAFNDQNDDDRFRVDLHYGYIPKARVSSMGERSAGSVVVTVTSRSPAVDESVSTTT